MNIKQYTESNNPYIHASFKNSGVDKMYNLFSEEKIRQKYAAGASKLKRSIRKNYGAKVDGKPIIAFLNDLMDDLQETMKQGVNASKVHTTGEKIEVSKSVFNKKTAKKEIQKYMKSVSQMGYSQGADFLERVNGELVNLNQYLNFLDRAIIDSEVLLNSNKISDFVINYFLQSEKLSAEERGSFSRFNSLFNDFLKSNEGKGIIISNGRLVGESTKVAEDVARLQAYKTAIEQIQSQYQEPDQKRFLKNGPFVVEKAVNRVGGFIFEPICNDAVNMSKIGLIESITSTLSGEKNAKIKLTKAMEKYREKSSTKNTEDISFRYHAGKDSVSTSISVDLPGASLKKISLKKGSAYQTAKIKSDNTLGFMFARAGLTTASGFASEYAAVNIIGNYRKAGSGISKANNEAVFEYIKAANLVYALSGTLSKGDSAYYFIVSHKVFKITDILSNLAKGGDLFAVKGELDPKQSNIVALNRMEDYSEADARSDAMYKKMLTAKYNLELKIKSSLF